MMKIQIMAICCVCSLMLLSSCGEEEIGVSNSVMDSRVAYDIQTLASQNKVFTADDGVITITPNTQVAPTVTPKKEQFTPVAEVSKEGLLGTLEIEKIALKVGVYEAANELEVMEKGAAHMPNTSSWDGNIGLAAHNATYSGKTVFFKDINKLAVGDTIKYTTTLGERSYIVETVVEISDEDWSYFNRTNDNRITLLTCITGKPTKRLVVQAKVV